MRIGVIAPSSRIEPGFETSIHDLAARLFPSNAPEIVFHPQCYLAHGHFAGDDAARAAAFLDYANDPAFDALWFVRGGYGAGRLAEAVLDGVTHRARDKMYMGYSDAGSLLGALYQARFPYIAHGPMPRDITRHGGEAAVTRALKFLVEGDPASLEASVGEPPSVAFNMAVFSALVGTPFQPDLTDQVLMLEEINEYMYRVDRFLFHITSNEQVRGAAGLRLGRVSQTPPNDPDFAMTEEEVAQLWCARSGIPYLGRADIGHDADNKVVPFGRWK